ncbi:ankyrin repeat domain-containing protein, partial [Citrobacter sp. Cf042]|uniref:ankyrin repeat domain-containing protein n=1 Tax=Citrobacter sp. Cf042 TaxID=2985045 RepID=UPI002581AF1F
TADRNRSHWSTSKTPSYTKSVSWQHHPNPDLNCLSRFGGVGITPASEKGHVEIVRELLLRTDINVNHTNFVGWTPLLEAIVLNDGGAKQQEIVKLLLDHGANPHMTDKYGKTPLELAREKGYHEIAELLIAAGA